MGAAMRTRWVNTAGLVITVAVAVITAALMPPSGAGHPDERRRAVASTAGDSGWIAWADKVGVHLVRPSGKHSHMLINKWGAREPDWSPNGRWLAYAQLTHDSYTTKKAAIYLIRPNGNRRHFLVHGYGPTWA